jgi:hypothetical protein
LNGRDPIEPGVSLRWRDKRTSVAGWHHVLATTRFRQSPAPQPADNVREVRGICLMAWQIWTCMSCSPLHFQTQMRRRSSVLSQTTSMLATDSPQARWSASRPRLEPTVIHGGAFEFIRNSALNAGNYFSKAVDPLEAEPVRGIRWRSRSSRTSSSSSPTIRVRGNHLTSSTNSTYTPTAAMLRGDFSAVPGHTDRSIRHRERSSKPGQSSATFSPGAVKLAALLPLGSDCRHRPHQLS